MAARRLQVIEIPCTRHRAENSCRHLKLNRRELCIRQLDAANGVDEEPYWIWEEVAPFRGKILGRTGPGLAEIRLSPDRKLRFFYALRAT
jgi:hypothetical protein